MGTAKPAAIGTFVVSGTDTLNENTAPTLSNDRVFTNDQIIQFMPDKNTTMFTVKIFFGAIRLGAGGKDHHPVVYRHRFLANAHPGEGGTEVSDETTHVSYFHPEMQGYEGVLANLLFQIHSEGLNLLSFPGPVDMVCLASQPIGSFHEMDRIAALCNGQCGLHSGYPATHDEGFRGNGILLFVKRFQKSCLGHGHAYQVFRLLSGSFGIVLMYPRILISDIGHFEKVLIYPDRLERISKQGLMRAR